MFTNPLRLPLRLPQARPAAIGAPLLAVLLAGASLSTSLNASLGIGLIASLMVGPAWSAPAPLLQPGKTSLYRRVLTRPGALLRPAPQDGPGQPLAAFTRFYVYAEQDQPGHAWLQVGSDTRGTLSGWLPAAETVPWPHQISAAFSHPGAGRERILFYRDWDSLAALLDADDPAAAAQALGAAIGAGARDPRVLAIEPEHFIDIRHQFYLLPILAHRETFTAAGHLVRGLEVAALTSADPLVAARAPDDDVVQLADFRAAVVFIIDSTISMQPYIEAVRAAVHQVYGQIDAAGLADQVAFGLVGFRAPSRDPARARALEYVARVYADPAEVDSDADFLARTADLREARVSTDHFDEDPYAGVLTALEEIPWTRFGARYAVLITDAGALSGAASVTGLHAEQVRSEAAARGVALLVLHLKTPLGRDNHAPAEAQYQVLADNPSIQRSLYFPVADGAVAALRRAVDTLSNTVVENIQAAARGEPAAGSALTAAQSPTERTADDPTDATLAELEAATRALGHAMHLTYLGEQAGTRPPDLFSGWISDRDLADPTLRAVEQRVLLSKDELSDLHQVLARIIDAAEAGLLQPDAFFASLRSIATQYGRDPSLANRPQATRLADLGLLGEYLEGLPYQSAVMALDQDTWSRWGTQRQFDFINGLKGKLRLYERYNADTDRWISLAPGSPPGEWVYPVPLSDLP